MLDRYEEREDGFESRPRARGVDYLVVAASVFSGTVLSRLLWDKE